MVFGFENGKEVLLKLGMDTTGITRGAEDAKRRLGEIGKTVDELGTKNVNWSKVFAISAAVTGAAAAVMMFGDRMNALNATMGVSAQQLGISTKRVQDLMLSYSDAGMSAGEFADTFDILVRAGMRNDEQISSTVMLFDDLGHVTGAEADVLTATLIPAFKAFKVPLQDVGNYTDELAYLFRNSMVDMSDFGTMSAQIGSKLNELGVTMEDEIAILKILSDTQGKEGRPATMLLRGAIQDLTQAETAATQATADYADSIQKMSDLTGDTAQITTDYQDTLASLADEQERIDDMTRDYVYRIGDEEAAIRKLTGAYDESMRAAQDVAGEKAKIEQNYGDQIGDQETKIKRIKADYAYAMKSAFGDTGKQTQLTEEYNRALADEEERLARMKRDKEEALTGVDTESAKAQAKLTEEYTAKLAEQEEQLRRTKEAQAEALSEATSKLAADQTKAAEEYNQKLIANQKEIDALKAKQEEYQATIEKGKTTKEDFFALLGMTPEQVALQVAVQQKESEGLAARVAALEEGKITAATKLEIAAEKTGIATGAGDLAGQLALPAALVGGVGGAVSIGSGVMSLLGLGGGAAGGTTAAGGAGAVGAGALALPVLAGGALGAGVVWGMEQLGILGLEHAYTNFTSGGKNATGKKGLIEGAGAWTGGAVSGAGAWLGGLIKDPEVITDGISDLMDDISKKTLDPLKGILYNAKSYGKNLITNLSKGTMDTIGKVTATAGTIVTEISAPIIDAAKKAVGWGSDVVSNIGSGITSTVSTLAEKAKDITSTITTETTKTASDAVKSGTDIVTNIAKGITDTVSTLKTKAEEIVNKVKTTLETTATGAWDFGKGVVTDTAKGIGDWVQGAASSISNFGQSVKGSILGLTTGAWEFGKKVVTDTEKGIEDWTGNLTTAANKIGQTIGDALSLTNLSIAVGKFTEFVGKIYSAILSTVISAEKIASTYSADIKKFFENLTSGIVTWVTNNATGLGAAVSSLVGKIYSAILSTVISAADIATTFANDIKTFFSNLVSGIVKWATTSVSDLKVSVSSLVGKIYSAILSTVVSAADIATTFAADIKTFFSNLVSGIVSWATTSVSDLKVSVSSLVGKIYSSILSTVVSAADVAANYANDIKTFFTNLVSGIVTWVTNNATNFNYTLGELVGKLYAGIFSTVISVSTLAANYANDIKTFFTNLVSGMYSWLTNYGVSDLSNSLSSITGMLLAQLLNVTISAEYIYNTFTSEIRKFFSNTLTGMYNWLLNNGVGALGSLLQSIYDWIWAHITGNSSSSSTAGFSMGVSIGQNIAAGLASVPLALGSISYGAPGMPAYSSNTNIYNTSNVSVDLDLSGITVRSAYDIDMLTTQIASKINTMWSAGGRA